MHILFVFIDGLGMGPDDPEVNPLVAFNPAFFRTNFGQALTGHLSNVVSPSMSLVGLDATLGVEGLPQSATGQTTLFTGINAAKFMGRHVQAFPGPQLIKLIEEHGLFKQAQFLGFTATSANMYSPNYRELVLARKRRHSVSTLLSLTADLPLRSIEEMQQGKAVYQDITNEMLPAFGVMEAGILTPSEAANNLLALSQEYSITLFEYFQTDRMGHKQNWEAAEKIVRTLDELLLALQKGLPRQTTVVITSDHGNFEDMSIKTHTINRIPFIVFGYKSEQIAKKIHAMTDVTPVILAMLKGMDDID